MLIAKTLVMSDDVEKLPNNELPPSNTTTTTTSNNTLANELSMLTCKVCSNMVDISRERDQHLVQYNYCYEATPICTKPPSRCMRYPCISLPFCKSSSKRFTSPKCKSIITPVPGLCRVTCAHCYTTFLFNTLNNTLARCPHCRKVSSVGPEFARTRSIIFLVFGLIALGITIGITDGMYMVYVGAFLVSILLLLRSLYYFCMKISLVEGPV